MHVELTDTVVIKRGDLFLWSLRDARLPARMPHPLGLWYRDCRFLAVHELRLNGAPVRALRASDSLGVKAVHELSGAELSVRIERALEGPDELRETIAVRSRARAAVRVDLELDLRADFEPMLAVRGVVERPERPPVERSRSGRTLRLAARGRDGVLRTTEVELDRELGEAADGTLRLALELAPGEPTELSLLYRVGESGPGRAAPRPARRDPPRRARISTDDELFDRVLRRSLQDLDLLRSESGGHSYYAAGVPWYATLFGRDSLIAATQMLAFAPGVAEGTLRLLGALLGRRVDDARDEQPGKVLHELRVGEPATLGETPFARYYGSADATALWLCLLCEHADWSGDLALFRELRPQVDAAVAWMERHGDLDGDGLIDYRRRSPGGLLNQGWRDSPDGVPDEAGSPLGAPVALVEVQGYAIRARRRVARLLELAGEAAEAKRLRGLAAAQEEALERFWLRERGGYAIGLDAVKRPGSGLTSNQGHLLWAGAVTGERARRIRDLLFEGAMFSGWGIRTLADGHPGFDPMGYHTGSVWPHDNALIAHGLRRYGFDAGFARLFEALLEAAASFDDHRLPELFGGHAREQGAGPAPYPVACRPQAWAAGAIPYMVQSGLGLCPDALAGRLRIVRPSLPRRLDRVEIQGLKLAGSTIDLRFERSGGQVALADARVEGDAEVVPSDGGCGP